MFLRLTEESDLISYVNVNEIRMFYRKEKENSTVLFLQYGTMFVKETPEEIIAMTERK